MVVEAATDLANSIWSPVKTNTLTSGSFDFSDPQERGQFLIMANIGETCSGDTAGGSKNPWKRVTYNTKQQPAGRNVLKLRTDPSRKLVSLK